MELRTIGQKYNIQETIYSDEMYSVYSASTSSEKDSQIFFVNEIKSSEYINNLKDSFTDVNKSLIDNFVETFFENDFYYVICKSCTGNSLESYLSENRLRLTDKMHITDSLLSRLANIDKINPLLINAILDTDKLSIILRKKFCFNLAFRLTEESLTANCQDVIKKASFIICSIFANHIVTDLESEREALPPALMPIFLNCQQGKYKNFTELYKDFKSLLMYSMFIENMSVDKQVNLNIEKAEKKKSSSKNAKVAFVMILLLLAIIGASYWNVRINKNSQFATLPNARFVISQSKIYTNEEVIFTSQSYDSDINDKITAYDWTISKNDVVYHTDHNQSFSYTFLESGNYTTSLTVYDSANNPSDAVISFFEVFDKPVIPESTSPPGSPGSK